MTDATTPEALEQILLVPMQNPEQDLMRLGQVFNHQGLTPIEEGSSTSEENPSWAFRTLDGVTHAQITLLGQLGVFRLRMNGSEASLQALIQILAQAVPLLTPNRLAQQIQTARGEEEQQVIITLLVLCFSNADEAMAQLSSLLDQENAAGALGLIEGLTYHATPEAAVHLQTLADQLPEPLSEAALTGLEQLRAAGVIEAPADPEAVLASAQTLLDEEQFADALALLDEEPLEHPRWALLRAAALLGLGQLDDALDAAEIASYDEETRLEAMVLRARCHERLGDMDAARLHVQAALKLDPTHAPAQRVSQRLALADASDDDRAGQLDAAIDADPEDPDLRIQRAALHLSDGQHDGALADLDVARAHTKDPRTDIIATEAHLLRGAYLSALRALYRGDLASLPPALLQKAALQRGRVFLALDALARAAASFAEIHRHFDLPAALLGRGLALELDGHPDRAQDAYRRALEAAPAADLVATLSPVTLAPSPVWEALSGSPVDPTDKPERRCGSDTIDPFFKYCLDCGESALRRRTSCKACGGKDFLT